MPDLTPEELEKAKARARAKALGWAALEESSLDLGGPADTGSVNPMDELGNATFRDVNDSDPPAAEPDVDLVRGPDGMLMERKYLPEEDSSKLLEESMRANAAKVDKARGGRDEFLDAMTGAGTREAVERPPVEGGDQDFVDVARKSEADFKFMDAMTRADTPEGVTEAINAATTPEQLQAVEAVQGSTGFDEQLAGVSSQEDITNAMNSATTLEELQRVEAEQSQFYAENPQAGPPDTSEGLMPMGDEEAELARRAAMTPDERMIEDARKASQREQFNIAQREMRLQEQADQQSRNLRTLQESNLAARKRTEELIAKTQELANKRVDPRRWYKNLGVHQHVAGMLAAAIHGALNPGGPNQTLMQAQRRIDSDINAQVQDLQNQEAGIKTQQGLVAQLYNQGMSAFEAAESARIAAYGRMDQELAIEAAKFDPMGTTVRRIETARAQARTMADEAAQKLETHNVELITKMRKAHLDEQEQNRKNIDTAADVQKKQREIALLDRKLSHRPGPARPKQASINDLVKADENGWYQGPDGLWHKDPNFKPSESKSSLETAKTKGDIQGQETRTAKLEHDLEVEQNALKVPTLKNADGSVYEALTPGGGDEIRSKKTAVDKATEVLDKVMAVRHEHGAEIFASENGKLMDALMQDLMLFKREAAKTGALDEGSVNVIMKSLTGGNKDPSKTLRSFDKAMEAARVTMVNGFNSDAKTQSKNPDAWENYQPPMLAIEETRRKTKEERRAGATQGIPEAFRNDPKQRAAAVEKMKADAGWFGNRDNPKIEELRGMGKELQRQMIEEGLKYEEAVSIAKPFAKTLAKKEHEKFQDSKMSELEAEHGKNLLNYAQTLKRVLNDDDEAIFDFVIRPGYVK